MKALVTGVAGFIGSHLAERLLETGHQVVGVDCFTDYYPERLKHANLASLKSRKDFSFFKTTIRNAEWSNLLCGVTHVFHLAGQPGVRPSWGTSFELYSRANVEATQILLEACVSTPLTRLVYASSSSVYGSAVNIPMKETDLPNPISPYGVTKLAAEHLCNLYHANHGVPAVSLRYFTVYGPRQRPDMAFNRFLSALLTDEPIHLYGDGNQTRDFTFVEDIVSSTIAAGQKGVPGRIYNIGGGSRVSINGVLEIMKQCTGQKPIVNRETTQKGDMRDTFADTTLAKHDLDFQSTVTLERGIQAEYQWLKSIYSAV